MTQIQIPVDVLLIVILSLVLILLSIYIYLSIKRIINNKALKVKEAYVTNYLADWNRYFRGEQSLKNEMIPKNENEILAVEDIFLAYINNFANEQIINKIKQFANEHLQKHYRAMLKNRKWSIKINALSRISDFQLEQLLKECKRLKDNKLSHEEYFLLLLIYSKMDATYFNTIIQSTNATFSENEYKRLLLELDLENLHGLIDHFSQLSSRFQYALIDVLGTKGDVDSLSFLEEHLGNDDDEIRIRVLKAINKIGIVLNWEKYFEFTESGLWEERLMVTKLFRNAPFELVLPFLKKLLKDESWWVRSEAARIIYDSKHGEDILKEIISVSTDQFAIDMATEYLNRSSL